MILVARINNLGRTCALFLGHINKLIGSFLLFLMFLLLKPFLLIGHLIINFFHSLTSFPATHEGVFAWARCSAKTRLLSAKTAAESFIQSKSLSKSDNTAPLSSSSASSAITWVPEYFLFPAVTGSYNRSYPIPSDRLQDWEGPQALSVIHLTQYQFN